MRVRLDLAYLGTRFEGWQDHEYSQWSDVVRVYPKPPKTFSSYRFSERVSIEFFCKINRERKLIWNPY